jgi:ATP-dependent DNA ligase
MATDATSARRATRTPDPAGNATLAACDGPYSLSRVAVYHRSVAFPIEPPIEPMLAKPTPELPIGEGWRYEPKWDGFRALVFRDGPDLYLQSRDLKPLDRYFPELLEPLRSVGGPKARFVLDGEIVIARDGGLQFESLLLRIHPAASRVTMLAAETPASFVAFDCLAEGAYELG